MPVPGVAKLQPVVVEGVNGVPPTAVTAALAPYRQGDTFVSYTMLTPADTKALAQAVAALAEPLSKVSKQVVAR